MWEETDRLRLVRLCAAISGDRQAAEDLAQETLLEAWRNAHKLTDPDGADRWLAAVARNVCLRWRHRRCRAEVPVAEMPELSFEHEDDDPSDLLAALPPAARELLVERYVHERSSSEIGASLGVSSDAVTMRLQRGKAALRRLLDAEGWTSTQLRCFSCGEGRLETRPEAGSIAFRCPACQPERRTAVFPLGNPLFERLVGGLERPSAMFARVGAWARGCYAAGDGARADCTRFDHGSFCLLGVA